MYKNIIFDWSGTINDNINDHVNHISHIFRKHGGRSITRVELRRKWTQPYMKFYNSYFPDWTLDQHKGYYRDSIDKFNTRKIYKGIRDLLFDLKKRGAKLYIITGDFSKTLFAEIKEYGLDGIFDKAITDSHDKKDDLVGLIKDEKMKLDQTVFVGDTVDEIECAKAAKIKSIAVTWGMNTPARLKAANPDFLVHNPKQLQKVLFS